MDCRRACLIIMLIILDQPVLTAYTDPCTENADCRINQYCYTNNETNENYCINLSPCDAYNRDILGYTAKNGTRSCHGGPEHHWNPVAIGLISVLIFCSLCIFCIQYIIPIFMDTSNWYGNCRPDSNNNHIPTRV